MRVPKLELTNRLKYIEKLIKEKRPIKTNAKVKKWGLSSKQLKRYIDKVVDSDRKLIELLRCKEFNKTTYRIAKPLREKLDKYCDHNDKTIQYVITRALHEFLRDNK